MVCASDFSYVGYNSNSLSNMNMFDSKLNPKPCFY